MIEAEKISFERKIGNVIFIGYAEKWQFFGKDIISDENILCPVCKNFFTNKKGILKHLKYHTVNSDLKHAKLYFEVISKYNKIMKKQIIKELKIKHQNSIKMLNQL